MDLPTRNATCVRYIRFVDDLDVALASYISMVRCLVSQVGNFSHIPPIWRLYPRFKVAHKASFPVIDRSLATECFVKSFLGMTCTHEVVKLRPEWLTSYEL